MAKTATRTDPRRPGSPSGETLASLVEELLSVYEELLGLAKERRGALAGMDAAAMQRCAEREATVLQRLHELEARRAALLGRRTAPGPKPTLAALAHEFPAPLRERVTAAAAKLKDLITAVQREHRAVRLASLALLGHMEGLMHQIGRRLSHAGLYGRGGCVESGPPAIRGLDLTH